MNEINFTPVENQLVLQTDTPVTLTVETPSVAIVAPVDAQVIAAVLAAISINGKSGAEITLSAADVGADPAGASAAVQAGLAAAFVAFLASLPTEQPSTPGQPWNNSGFIVLSS